MNSKTKAVVVGCLASLALVMFYVLIFLLTKSLPYILDQFKTVWPWITLIVIGFGVQMGLFSYLHSMKKQMSSSAKAQVAASGGVSATAMVACCAHHLSELLPIVGLGLAASFFVKYQKLFLIIGVISNGIGIAYMGYLFKKCKGRRDLT